VLSEREDEHRDVATRDSVAARHLAWQLKMALRLGAVGCIY
jgi:hypothetical protein